MGTAADASASEDDDSSIVSEDRSEQLSQSDSSTASS
jgi:hypothetical protein